MWMFYANDYDASFVMRLFKVPARRLTDPHNLSACLLLYFQLFLGGVVVLLHATASETEKDYLTFSPSVNHSPQCLSDNRCC